MTKILDGLAVAQKIKDDIKNTISDFESPPCLAVVLCSDDPASAIYVAKKQQACEEVGILSRLIKVESGESMENLLSIVDQLNNDSSVHGILVQLPLPKHLDAKIIFDSINPSKDVDVFSPSNIGLLMQGRPRFVPCTPQGIQAMLLHHDVEIAGKKVCIINRSDIVGKPLSALLIQDDGNRANATVTTCHDRTPPEILQEICLSSDIIIVAVGKAGFLTADMVPLGAVVVDVGINRVAGTNRIVGDVDFEAVSKKTSWISTVPGGVGPCTVSCLLKNTVEARKGF